MPPAIAACSMLPPFAMTVPAEINGRAQELPVAIAATLRLVPTGSSIAACPTLPISLPSPSAPLPIS